MCVTKQNNFFTIYIKKQEKHGSFVVISWAPKTEGVCVFVCVSRRGGDFLAPTVWVLAFDV